MTTWRADALATIDAMVMALGTDGGTGAEAASAMLRTEADILSEAGGRAAQEPHVGDAAWLVWVGAVYGALKACGAFLGRPEPTHEAGLAAGQALGVVMGLRPLLAGQMVPSGTKSTAVPAPGAVRVH